MTGDLVIRPARGTRSADMPSKPSTFAIVLLVLAVPIIATIVVVVTLAVTDDSGADAVAATPGKPVLDIRNFQYEPKPLVVSTGDRIVVVNSDDTAHTVTSDKDGLFDTGDLAGGDGVTLAALEPGTYDYFCAIPNYMRGSIRVTK